MKSLVKLAVLFAAVATTVTHLPSTASAASPRVAVPADPYVAVPAPGHGDGFAGSWKVRGLLYDQYRLNVWFDRYGGGSYSARLGWGKGTCDGSLTWYQTGNGAVKVQLRRSNCTDYSTVWTADQMICRGDEYGFSTRVAVPRPGYGAKLSCSYLPGSYDYPATHVSLGRT